MATGDIGTIDEYKDDYRNGALSVNSDNAPSDAQIQLALSAVSQEVSLYCGITFTGAEEDEYPSFTERCSGNGSAFIRVKNLPVREVESVSIVGADGSTTELDADSYRVDYETGAIGLVSGDASLFASGADEGGQGFADEFLNVEVVYSGGYKPEETPANLRWAVYQTVDELLYGVGVRGTEKKPSVSDLVKLRAFRFAGFRRIAM